MSTKWSRFCRTYIVNLWRRSFATSSKIPASQTSKYPRKKSKHKTFQFISYAILPPYILMTNTTNTQITIADVEDNVAHLMTLARIALERGDTEKAEAILEMGLKLCEEHKIYIAIPYMYDILVTIAFAESDTEKAETLLVTVVEKLAKIGTPETDHYIVDFKLRLARIYSGKKENELADIGFKSCLETQKEKIRQGDVSTRTGMLYVNALFWYGIHKIRNEKYSEAKEMLATAYDFSNKIKGLSPYQEMVILYTLADLNYELEDYDLALQNMLNAILLGKGISSMDMPRCYVKLGKIYVKMGDKENAKRSVKEGLKLGVLFNNVEVVEEAETVLKGL